MRGHTAFIVAIALACGLGGCALTRGADRPVLLKLDPLLPTVTAATRKVGAVALAPVTAEGTAGQLRYAYVAADGSLRQAATLFWDQPPPRALEAALRDALGQRIAQVRAAGEPGSSDRRVTTSLVRFEEMSGPGARAVVELRARIDGLRSWSGRWCAQAPLEGGSPGERAAAFNRASGAAIAALAADIAGEVENGGTESPGSAC